MILSGGNPSTFIERPISVVLLVMTLSLLAMLLLPSFKRTRDSALKAD